MRYFEMQIGKEGALMRGYLHEKSESWPQFDERPCVVVCPGGGYGFLSDREMDPVTGMACPGISGLFASVFSGG